MLWPPSQRSCPRDKTFTARAVGPAQRKNKHKIKVFMFKSYFYIYIFFLNRIKITTSYILGQLELCSVLRVPPSCMSVSAWLARAQNRNRCLCCLLCRSQCRKVFRIVELACPPRCLTRRSAMYLKRFSTLATTGEGCSVRQESSSTNENEKYFDGKLGGRGQERRRMYLI